MSEQDFNKIHHHLFVACVRCILEESNANKYTTFDLSKIIVNEAPNDYEKSVCISSSTLWNSVNRES
ncbi:hypothetical protein CR513_60797, partial [Mucuna pruriens]